MRKGFDLFLQLWRQTAGARKDGGCTHLVWTGDLDPEMRGWMESEIAQALESGRFHMPGRIGNMSDYLSAADAFVLTSREDPYPSVVMEAMASGLPCVAFSGSGGAADLVAQLTVQTGLSRQEALVPLGDAGQMARQAQAAARKCQEAGSRVRARRARRLAAQFPFADYTEKLLSAVRPQWRRISVVVLSYNYARFLVARLASVFSQDYPVLEIIVLDDASSDDSLEVARSTAAEWGRDIRIVAGKKQSGNVFAQWRKAVSEARGDWLWVAEADDIAAPDMLSRLCEALDEAPRGVMAFCDSSAIDGNGAPMFESYKPYYATTAGALLEKDGVHEGPEFVSACLGERNLIMNASAVLFRRDALQAALARCEDLETFRVAGDWRLYVELLSMPDSQIAYVARPLNVHRRHATSATGSLASEAHLSEIARVHRVIDIAAGREDLSERQKAYREEVARQFGPEK
ncbi:glycosyltransferase [Acetobacter sp. AN02]|nr:glycosyltransferase [Acetobacter sp. AN02]MDG6093660.1 glycosyltransferase [Acetobacter sp. AN02]